MISTQDDLPMISTQDDLPMISTQDDLPMISTQDDSNWPLVYSFASATQISLFRATQCVASGIARAFTQYVFWPWRDHNKGPVVALTISLLLLAHAHAYAIFLGSITLEHGHYWASWSLKMHT
jgi:hypothetical protein